MRRGAKLAICAFGAGLACMPPGTPIGPAGDPGTGGRVMGGAGGVGSGGSPNTGGSGANAATGGRGGGGGNGSGGQGGSGGAPADASSPEVDPPIPDAADAGGGDGGAPVAGPLARGVTIIVVDAAQGVFVPLFRAGSEVAPNARKAELIEGRPLFVRAHVTLAPGFAPRRLRGVLTAAVGEAAPVTFSDEKMIMGPSRANDLSSTFNFLLPAPLITPTTKLAVTIHEIAPTLTPEPAPLPRFPAQGRATLGVRAGKMELDLVIVRAQGVGPALMDTPERRQRVEKYLYDVYPVQKLNVRWRDPITMTRRISRADGFSLLQRTRTMDGAKPHEYYHLLIAVEDTSESLLGIANLAGPTPNDGARRIAMTFVRKRAIDSELDTISHEMGHNHGQNHVAGCNASGVDPNYPYANTAVGVDGFSLSDKTLKPAAMFKDLMGYCYPTWISDYTFAAFARRVRAVSAFASANQPGPVALLNRSLQGFVGPEGEVRWGVVDGALVPPDQQSTPTRIAHIEHDDGTRSEAAVSVQALGDDGVGREIAVTLPTGAITHVRINVDGKSYILGPGDHLFD